jgi:hypothetical protein
MLGLLKYTLYICIVILLLSFKNYVMKIKIKQKSRPSLGQIRIDSFFAIFPVYIGNEIRWLERVKIKQIYSSGSAADYTDDHWKDIEFVN